MKPDQFKWCVVIAGAWLALLLTSCKLPSPDKKKAEIRVKHNYIVLLDLSDRLIVQDNQPERDKQILKSLYTAFEEKVRKDLYIKSRDEIKVVIAPQLGSGLRREEFEDRLYVNMESTRMVYRKTKEEDRRANFHAYLDTLYNQAVFSQVPEDYHGADIWKYFHEDLRIDYSRDTLTENFLFILTDGYPIVGHNQAKLMEVRNEFPNLRVILVEAAPRERDMEWDRVMGIWENWFDSIGVKDYTLIKRGSMTKELEQIRDIVSSEFSGIASR